MEEGWEPLAVGTNMPPFFLKASPFICFQHFFFFFCLQYPAVWLDMVLELGLPEQGTSQGSRRTSASTDKCPIFFLPSGRVEMPSLQSQGIKTGSWALATGLLSGTRPALSPWVALSDSLLPIKNDFFLQDKIGSCLESPKMR